MNRSGRVLAKLAISLASGVLILGIVAVVTHTPEGASTGFPFAWSAPVTPCSAPNPLNGCGVTYSIPVILLDYSIWAVIVFALAVVAGRLRVRAEDTPAR